MCMVDSPLAVTDVGSRQETVLTGCITSFKKIYFMPSGTCVSIRVTIFEDTPTIVKVKVLTLVN